MGAAQVIMETDMNQAIFDAMAQSIVDGEVAAAADLARQSIAQKIDPLDAINNGFAVGIAEMGERFGRGDAFLPDLVLAGGAMKAAMDVLEPELARHGAEREIIGVVVLATVQGDIHDIGKNIVGTMLSASGFETYDLGVDVSPLHIVEKVRETGADVVALSALLTTTMLRQKDVVEALEEAGLRDRVKVIVGGAPVTHTWAKEIGADGFGEDAVSAVKLAKKLIGTN
jgi:corrinoid protein of di/trimethylamine methyltransferase